MILIKYKGNAYLRIMENIRVKDKSFALVSL